MGRQLTIREELRLQKTAWNELEGHLLQGLGRYKKMRARVERDHIQRPMPNDMPHLLALGSKVKAVANTLSVMKEIKTSLYCGRDLTSWQSTKLQEIEEAAGDEPVS